MADNRKVVEQYIQAMAARDWEAQDRLLSDDFVEEYPQSGEVIRVKDNRRGIIENYPGGEPRETSASGPSPKPQVITGAGDQFTATGQIKYPNGETWHIVSLIELRGHTCSHPEHSSQAHQRRRYSGRRSPGK